MTISIHKRDGISFIRNSDLTEEDQELFGLFNLAAACPCFSSEGKLSCSHDYNRYLERKKSYIKRYKGTNEFSPKWMQDVEFFNNDQRSSCCDDRSGFCLSETEGKSDSEGQKGAVLGWHTFRVGHRA